MATKKRHLHLVKLLDLDDKGIPKHGKGRQPYLTDEQRAYNKKRASWAQNKARTALVALYPDDYSAYYAMALDVYDDTHKGGK